MRGKNAPSSQTNAPTLKSLETLFATEFHRKGNDMKDKTELALYLAYAFAVVVILLDMLVWRQG